jgi:RNA polymerase sigma-70 factor (ECF subfamily)
MIGRRFSEPLQVIPWLSQHSSPLHRGRLFHCAFSVLRNREDAEDALQDGLLSAYGNLKSFEGRSRFSTWLTRIVINAALMKRRKRCATPSLSLDGILLDDPNAHPTQIADARPGPEQAAALAQTNELLQEGINKLPPRLRLALQLRDVENLSNREAALVAGIDTSAIKSRTSRARKHMAAFLIDRGLDASHVQTPWRVSDCNVSPKSATEKE